MAKIFESTKDFGCPGRNPGTTRQSSLDPVRLSSPGPIRVRTGNSKYGFMHYKCTVFGTSTADSRLINV